MSISLHGLCYQTTCTEYYMPATTPSNTTAPVILTTLAVLPSNHASAPALAVANSPNTDKLIVSESSSPNQAVLVSMIRPEAASPKPLRVPGVIASHSPRAGLKPLVAMSSVTFPIAKPGQGKADALGLTLAVSNVTELAAPQDTVPSIDIEAENVLVGSIQSLWSARKTSSQSAKKSREASKERRQLLATQLRVYKSLLVGTGRDGRWASFLRQEKIPRATVERWIKGLDPVDSAGAVSSPFPEPTRERVVALFGKLLPRILQVVTTQDAVRWFFAEAELALKTANPVS
jgi:hypothetical protein